MDTRDFESLVEKVITELPDAVKDHMMNVDIVLEERPTAEQLVGSGIEKDQLLLGLYEGLPLTERHDYGMVLPDKITLFKEQIETVCQNISEVEIEIRNTVIHEIAHHFGIAEERLEMLEN